MILAFDYLCPRLESFYYLDEEHIVSVKQLKNFVGGKYVAPTAGETSDVINPSTGQVYATAPVSSASDVKQAYEVAQKVTPC